MDELADLNRLKLRSRNGSPQPNTVSLDLETMRRVESIDQTVSDLQTKVTSTEGLSAQAENDLNGPLTSKTFKFGAFTTKGANRKSISSVADF